MEQVQDKYEFQVSWEPYLLRPSMPKEGVPKPPGNQVSGHLKTQGEAVGINFTGKVDRYPYTLTAHALLEYAKSVDDTYAKQNQLQEVIFQGYFTDGIYPGEDNLLQMAKQVGLDEAGAKAAMQDPSHLDKARNTALGWSEKGVSGVPYFIMNGQKVFSGAQGPDTIIRMFEIVSERFPLETSAAPQASM